MLVYNKHLLFNVHGMNLKIYKWNLVESCLRNLKSVDSLVIITENIERIHLSELWFFSIMWTGNYLLVSVQREHMQVIQI
jgi:hypothetical protein